MTGTEEASARKGKMAPRIVWRKLDRIYFRSFCIAPAAAIFVCSSSRPVAAHMNTNIVQASSSLQSLISVICWLAGFGFAVNGGIKVFRAARMPADDPRHGPLRRRGILYLVVGIGCIFYPFIQAAFDNHPPHAIDATRTTYDAGR